MTTEEDQVTGNAQRAAELIRTGVAVHWPAGHLEIALIQIQRRRQARRAKLTVGALGLGGLAIFVALGGTSHVRELASNVLPDWMSPALFGLAPAAPAEDVATTTAQPVATPAIAAQAPAAGQSASAPVYGPAAPARAAVAEAVAPREGHLLQQRLVPRRQVAAARWMALAGQ